MIPKPRLLDLFARAQGSSVGYARAGFDVTAVDKDLYPRHPEVSSFIRADAFEVMADIPFMRSFDFIAASPNCEGYTDLARLPTTAHRDREIPRVRGMLEASGRPFLIENVDSVMVRAEMIKPFKLCGSVFPSNDPSTGHLVSAHGLGAWCRDLQWRQLRRHRLFEPGGGARDWLYQPFACRHAKFTGGVYGTGGGGPQTRGYRFWPEEAREAMGIDWMKRADICKAIPPKYTELLGRWMMAAFL